MPPKLHSKDMSRKSQYEEGSIDTQDQGKPVYIQAFTRILPPTLVATFAMLAMLLRAKADRTTTREYFTDPLRRITVL